VTYGEGGLAVLALEAGPVEDGAVGGELVHGVHRLGAHLALLLRPAEHPVSSRVVLPSSTRDLRERDPTLACAREERALPPGIEIGALIYAEDEMRLSSGIMMGFVSPSSARSASHLPRRKGKGK
jgi:hypothetical protein